ncbi:MAG: hypothetical protein ACRBFS_09055 [Aureispira sp.]
MIKHTLVRGALLFCAITSSGLLFAQEIKVKSVEYKVFEHLPEAEEGMDLELTKKELKQYDKQGRIAKQEVYLANPIGKLVPNTFIIREWLEDMRTEKIIKFDEMGDSITAVKTYTSNKGKLKVKEESVNFIKAPKKMLIKEFEYTEFGKPLKVVFSNKKGDKTGEEVYKYNSEDEEISYKKWELLSDGNKATESKKTTYTKEGFLESSEKIIKDGKDTYKDVIIFEGTKIKEQTKYKNGEAISSFGGKAAGGYDPKQGTVMMEFGGGDDDEGGFGSFGGGFGGMLPEVEDEFDDKGNKIKTTETEGIELVKEITYKYDDNSNLLEMEEIKYEDGEEESTKKEQLAYDEQNNLTKKTVYKDGDKTKEEQFKYSYYGKKSEEAPAKEEAKPDDKEAAAEAPKEEPTDKKPTPDTKEVDDKKITDDQNDSKKEEFTTDNKTAVEKTPAKQDREKASDNTQSSQLKIVDKKEADKE